MFNPFTTGKIMGKILLYYKYIFIEDPHAIKRWQQTLCTELGLKGRILIGKEGINGTVGGTDENTEKYIQAMRENEFFHDVDFKSSEGGSEYFPKLRVAVRDEIVTMGINPENLKPEDGGKHLTPEQTHKLLQEHPENLVILDARNEFEARIGKFTGAVVPPIENFRDFPAYIDENIEMFKDKQVLMYCTGGIRCERATAYLNKKGVAEQVYQIEGGIHRYTEQFPDGFFRGKNYVFDGRIAMRINDDVLSTCYRCTTACDDYTNCVNTLCNLQFLACPDCVTHYGNCCSAECKTKVENNEVAIRSQPAKVDHVANQSAQ